MASSESSQTHAQSTTTGAPTNELNVIWQMALASLSANNNEVMIPQTLCRSIGYSGIKDLTGRLSSALGGARIGVEFDHESNLLRILNLSVQEERPSRSPSMTMGTPSSSLVTPQPFESSSAAYCAPKSAAHEKKKKVPRPPNAFILYRSYWHPVLKNEDVNLHNNEISVILGKRWKEESEEVKEEYKSMAEELKRKHAEEYPDYQYAPRKSSERKKKRAALKAKRNESVQTLLDDSTNEAGVLFSPPVSVLSPETDSQQQTGQSSVPIAKEAAIYEMNHRMNVNLPIRDNNIQASVDDYLVGSLAGGTLSFLDQHRDQVESFSIDALLRQQTYLNSIVDWDALERDLYSVPAQPHDLNGLDFSTQQHWNMTNNAHDFVGVQANAYSMNTLSAREGEDLVENLEQRNNDTV